MLLTKVRFRFEYALTLIGRNLFEDPVDLAVYYRYGMLLQYAS